MSVRDISIRKFRTEDAKAVANIFNSCIHNPDKNESDVQITPKYILTLSNKRKMYVALADHKIIGAAGIDHDRIYTVFVDKGHNNKGTLEGLVSLLEEIADNNGVQHIKLEAAMGTQKLYERLGYNNTQETVANELGEFVVMEKYLV